MRYLIKICFLKIFILTAAVWADNFPLPPEIKSDIGYLTVEKDVIIPPDFESYLIIPHVELLVLNEDNDDFKLIYIARQSSFACKIPKYAKNMVLLREGEDENFISFRGPIEAKTIPIQLKNGEELPVKKKDNGNYAVEIKRKDTLIPLLISETTPGVVFSTKSEFAKFAEKQKKKGLAYFQGKWLPKEEVITKKNFLQKKRDRKQKLWKNIKKGAANGVVILKDNGVLHGKLTGSNEDNILFECENRDYFLSLDDIAPLNFETIMAKGKLDLASTDLNNARIALKKNLGMAMFHAENALIHLQGISKKSENEFKCSEEMVTEISSLIDDIDVSLKKSGKAIYRNLVFPLSELNYHLDNGHLLLRNKIWLKPEQICKECHASGKLTCFECQGEGRIKKDCPFCVNGRVTCTICNGKGIKDCDYCGGKGYIYKEKPRSTVFASFGSGRRCYYPNYNPGTMIYSKDKLIVIKPYRYYYPCYSSGSYISIGNEGGGVEKTVCPKCNGRGILPCPKTIKCASCQGVGYFIKTCPTCKGNKKLFCNKCKGKGYIGDPQVMPEKPIHVEKPKDGNSYFNSPVVLPWFF